MRAPRTPEEAVRDAERVLEMGMRGESALNGGEVTSNPGEVNDPGTGIYGRMREAKAQLVLQQNAALEEEALQGLTPEQQAQYKALRQFLKDAEDPLALLSLQKMLLNGELPGARALGGTDDVLSGLHGLISQPLADGVDRSQLLTDAVQELACPSAVAQQGKGTCAATSVEILLLRENPAEYVRILAGLASPEGTVRLASGDVVRREEGTAAEDGTGRSVPQRLIAPVFMEYANGRADYDNSTDHHTEEGVDKGRGLSAAQVDLLLEGIFGKDFTFANVVGTPEAAEAAWQFIQEELAAGRAVLVGLRWGGGGHKVVVTGTETLDGERWVTFINPWGQEERLPEAEFLERLRNLNYEATPPGSSGGGGGGGVGARGTRA
jgi:hypothetical protein